MINFIRKYICMLKKEDINNFALKNNIYLSTDEISTIYNVINIELDNLIQNSDEIFLKYKNSFTVENYTKIYNLFNEYKKKYKNYL